MRKSFELSAETLAIVQVFLHMTLGQQMSFAELSAKVKFIVTSTTGAYHSARRVVERDHGVFIGTTRGAGFFRGSGDDMADSLEPLAKRMRRTAKKSVDRADLAIANNLPEEKYQRVVERRNRASIIFSTTAAPLPSSNRKRPPPAPPSPPTSPFGGVRSVR